MQVVSNIVQAGLSVPSAGYLALVEAFTHVASPVGLVVGVSGRLVGVRVKMRFI